MQASNPLLLQDGTNTYVWGLGLISATDGSGNQTYFLPDGLGSTANLIDGSGNVTASYSYDAFGAVRSHTGSGSSEFTFTSEQNDPNGLEYLRARYYDEATGRFLGRDPADPDYDDPRTLNRFMYGLANPGNVTDPSGECIFCHSTINFVLKALESPCGSSMVIPVVGAEYCDAGLYAAAMNALGLEPGYVDIGTTICGSVGVCFTGGFQYSLDDGLHVYWGGGVGTGFAATLNFAPGQSITTGESCGYALVFSGDPVGGSVQVGYSGIIQDGNGDNVGDFSIDDANFFAEFGVAIGSSGTAVTCVSIF